MRLCAGLDVGGTKIEACVTDTDTGEVFARKVIPTEASRNGGAVLGDCVALVEALADGKALEAVGIGICELVDLSGRIVSANTIDWRDLDVVGAFGQFAPTRLEADVRAAALAEATFGVGRELREPWLYVSIGTGISYALVQDGHPFTGARGNAIIVGAPPVELIASGRALAQAAGLQRAEEVLANPTHAQTVREGAEALGNALANLANALDPAKIVVGGGLGLNRNYREAVVAAMRLDIEAPETRNVPVVASTLGSLAAALGAALAASAAVGEVRT